MNDRSLFTSESVTEGHPDKICDQVSDAILDEIISKDLYGRVACETLVTTGVVYVAGEITTRHSIDVPAIVRRTVKQIGYDDAACGFDYKTCGIITAIQKQSPDIAMGVNKGGAGDQGMMFGYATNETKELMPMPITLAHKLVRRLAEVRKKKILNFLRPDGKSQVSVEYEDGRPVRVNTIVIAAQHGPKVKRSRMNSAIIREVVKKVVPGQMMDSGTRILINPTGRFEIGGPQGDTGVTGRKIMVDTYGSAGRNGGGAFSGKDPTKVDRSASYAARYVAKNVVAAGLAERFEVQIAYAIGVAQPVSIAVETFGTERVPKALILQLIRDNFDLTPLGIIKTLKLRRPIYTRTAAYGHFGRTEPGFTWERTDKAAAIRRAAGI